MFRVLNLAPAARRYLESTGQQDGQDSLAGVNKTDTVPRASGSGVRAFAFGLLVIVAHFLSAEVRLGHKGNTVVLYASTWFVFVDNIGVSTVSNSSSDPGTGGSSCKFE